MVRSLRKNVQQRDMLEQQIAASLMSSDIWQSATKVLAYVSVRDEVSTEMIVAELLGPREPQHERSPFAKQLVLPWCCGDELQLCVVHAWDELVPGAFGIPEPSISIRALPQRAINPQQIDLAIIPGVAFDRRGNRLGSGKGYYDRLLPALPRLTLKVGLAFNCQLLSQIPVEPHDFPLDVIVTPDEWIDCRAEAAR